VLGGSAPQHENNKQLCDARYAFYVVGSSIVPFTGQSFYRKIEFGFRLLESWVQAWSACWRSATRSYFWIWKRYLKACWPPEIGYYRLKSERKRFTYLIHGSGAVVTRRIVFYNQTGQIYQLKNLS